VTLLTSSESVWGRVDREMIRTVSYFRPIPPPVRIDTVISYLSASFRVDFGLGVNVYDCQQHSTTPFDVQMCLLKRKFWEVLVNCFPTKTLPLALAATLARDGIIRDCHHAAEAVGVANVNSRSPAEAFGACVMPGACGEYCLQGVVVALMRRAVDSIANTVTRAMTTDKLPRYISEWCESVQQTSSVLCARAVGTALRREGVTNRTAVVEFAGTIKTCSAQLSSSSVFDDVACIEGYDRESTAAEIFVLQEKARGSALPLLLDDVPSLCPVSATADDVRWQLLSLDANLVRIGCARIGV
jgi:hypothetical protein